MLRPMTTASQPAMNSGKPSDSAGYEPTGATLGRYVAVVSDALAGTGEFGGPPAS